jgi:hypothetical protein
VKTVPVRAIAAKSSIRVKPGRWCRAGRREAAVISDSFLLRVSFASAIPGVGDLQTGRRRRVVRRNGGDLLSGPASSLYKKKAPEGPRLNARSFKGVFTGKTRRRAAGLQPAAAGGAGPSSFFTAEAQRTRRKTRGKAVVLFTDRSVRLVHSRQVPRTPHQFVLVGTERDTWVKTPAGWKSSLSENLKSQAFMDGKPLTPRRVRPKK